MQVCGQHQPIHPGEGGGTDIPQGAGAEILGGAQTFRDQAPKPHWHRSQQAHSHAHKPTGTEATQTPIRRGLHPLHTTPMRLKSCTAHP